VSMVRSRKWRENNGLAGATRKIIIMKQSCHEYQLAVSSNSTTTEN
jgi:hypothetical protein